jgi:hypothetical protein
MPRIHWVARGTGIPKDRDEVVVYYESIKREPKIRGIYECRCDERLQTKSKEFTRLAYTGLVLELEHVVNRRVVYFFICSRVKKGEGQRVKNVTLKLRGLCATFFFYRIGN